MNAENNRDYLERLRLATEHLHQCSAFYVGSVRVHEKFQGQTVWTGIVEVFDLKGHSRARRCYAWSDYKGKDDKSERVVAILEMPPVNSAESAVRAQIVKDVKSA